MNKSDLKRVISKLGPDHEMEYRLSKKLLKSSRRKPAFKHIASVAVSLALVIGLGVIGNSFIGSKTPVPNSTNGIYIPKLELPEQTNTAMDMIGLIVYEGRIYTQAGTTINPENAKILQGEKLGTTKGNIDEWSKQDEYAIDFASTIRVQDVYAVKGYDKSFRIMTFSLMDGTVNAQFYECLNGITVKTGDDIFGKLMIEDNINTAKYENFDSWNYNKQQYKEFTKLDKLNSFTRELKNTIPHSRDNLEYLFNEESGTDQKFIYLTLNDGSEVQLRLFKQGYIYYSNSPLFFKMENIAFNNLWNSLE